MSERSRGFAPTAIDHNSPEAQADIAQWESQFEQTALPAGPSASVERAVNRVVDVSDFTVKDTELGRMPTEANQDNVIDAEVIDVTYDKELPSPEKQHAHETLGKIGHATLELAAKAEKIAPVVIDAGKIIAAGIANPENPKLGEMITEFGNKYVPEGWVAKQIKEHGGIIGTAKAVGRFASDRWNARKESRKNTKEQAGQAPAETAQAEIDADAARYKEWREKQHAESVYDEAVAINEAMSPGATTETATTSHQIDDNTFHVATHKAAVYETAPVETTANAKMGAAHTPETAQANPRAFGKNGVVPPRRKARAETTDMDPKNETSGTYDTDSPAVERAFDIDPDDEEAIREEVIAKLVAKRQKKLRRQKARRDRWNSMSTTSKEHWATAKNKVSNGRIGKACKGIARWTRLGGAIGKGIGTGAVQGARTAAQNHRAA